MVEHQALSHRVLAALRRSHLSSQETRTLVQVFLLASSFRQGGSGHLWCSPNVEKLHVCLSREVVSSYLVSWCCKLTFEKRESKLFSVKMEMYASLSSNLFFDLHMPDVAHNRDCERSLASSHAIPLLGGVTFDRVWRLPCRRGLIEFGFGRRVQSASL